MKHPLHQGHSQGHPKRGGIIESGERGGLRKGQEGVLKLLPPFSGTSLRGEYKVTELQDIQRS